VLARAARRQTNGLTGTMERLRETLIWLAMLAIGASVGLVLSVSLGRPWWEAALAAALVVLGMALQRLLMDGTRQRMRLASKLDDLSVGTGDLARQVSDIVRRVHGLEARPPVRPEVAEEAEPEPPAPPPALASDVAALSAVVTQLAETIAAQDQTIADLRERVEVLSRRRGADSIVRAPAALVTEVVPPPAVKPPDVAIAALAREAVLAGRLDLAAEPVVTLPQRKLRFHDLIVDLRNASGETIQAATYGPALAAHGGRLALDEAVVLRALQMLRRLNAKSREAGLMCPVALSSLTDAGLQASFQASLSEAADLIAGLVFVLPRESLEAIGPVEATTLGTLTGLGLRLCADARDGRHFDPKRFADLGVRYAKVEAAVLAGSVPLQGSDIHPADLPGYYARSGIDLIATGVESESRVVDILDTAANFGQGKVFGGPRPVKLDEARSEPGSTRPATTTPAAPAKPVEAARPVGEIRIERPAVAGVAQPAPTGRRGLAALARQVPAKGS
jgi:cyclic-di-GMP phosphodiesterase TipF (flagellum assembly factor)